MTRPFVPPGGFDTSTLSPIFVGGMPLDALNAALKANPDIAGQRQAAGQRFWSSPPRPGNDATRDIVEINLNAERRVNTFAFEVARFPHACAIEAYVGSAWVPVLDTSGHPISLQVLDSVPSLLPGLVVKPGSTTHPQHYGAEHWVQQKVRTAQVVSKKFRFVFTRLAQGSPPVNGARQPVPYSVGLRGTNIGFEVLERADIPAEQPFTATLDMLGSAVTYSLRENPASNLLSGSVWRSEPQPIPSAVVNLYVDSRDPNGAAQVIDRFALDPITSGAVVNLYYSNDDAPTTVTTDLYEQMVWTPVHRDYVLRKGNFFLPPTRAKHFKFEFTNLIAEPYEVSTPITRKVKVHTFRTIVASRSAYSSGVRTPSTNGGAGAVTNENLAGVFRYADEARTVAASRFNKALGYTPTEALVSDDPATEARLRSLTHLYGFKRWSPGLRAPRFVFKEQHVYEIVDVEHTQRVAYFVALKGLQMFRVEYVADDDTEQYIEHFDDAHNLASSSWVVEGGDLRSPEFTAIEAVATSRVFKSRRSVRAIQFATQQSPPVQLLTDPDFNDVTHSRWRAVGDATIADGGNTFGTDIGTTMRVTRAWVGGGDDGQEAVLGTYDSIGFQFGTYDGIEQSETSDFFPTYNTLLGAEDGTEEVIGGIEGAELVSPSKAGRVYAAARVIAPKTLSAPLWVQIVSESGVVLAEREVTVAAGQVTEWFVGYSLADSPFVGGGGNTWDDVEGLDPSPTAPTYTDLEQYVWQNIGADEVEFNERVYPRVIQKIASDDEWYVDTISVFDDAILWEFSNDGGEHFWPVFDIRNNAHGVFVFPPLEDSEEDPDPDTELVWRVTGYRPDLHISSLIIRPWYADLLSGVSSREGIQAGGPNTTPYDHYPPVAEDPHFKVWDKPIPQEWYFFFRQFLLGREPETVAPTLAYQGFLDDDLTPHDGPPPAGDAPGPVLDMAAATFLDSYSNRRTWGWEAPNEGGPVETYTSTIYLPGAYTETETGFLDPANYAPGTVVATRTGPPEDFPGFPDVEGTGNFPLGTGTFMDEHTFGSFDNATYIMEVYASNSAGDGPITQKVSTFLQSG